MQSQQHSTHKRLQDVSEPQSVQPESLFSGWRRTDGATEDPREREAGPKENFLSLETQATKNQVINPGIEREPLQSKAAFEGGPPGGMNTSGLNASSMYVGDEYVLSRVLSSSTDNRLGEYVLSSGDNAEPAQRNERRGDGWNAVAVDLPHARLQEPPLDELNQKTLSEQTGYQRRQSPPRMTAAFAEERGALTPRSGSQLAMPQVMGFNKAASNNQNVGANVALLGYQRHQELAEGYQEQDRQAAHEPPGAFQNYAGLR